MVVPPLPVVEKVTAVVYSVLQTTWSSGSSTCPVGLTVIVNSSLAPSQLTPSFVNVGVTVIVAITGDVPVFTAANAAMSPEPLAANPIEVSSFVHAYVVVPPVFVVVNVTNVVLSVLQTTWSAGSST